MARRTKYFYNPKSLSFEKVSDHRRYVLWRRFGASSLFVVLVVGLSFLISYFYERFNLLPSQQNNYLVLNQMELVGRQLEEFEKRMTNLEDNENNIYRSIFNVSPPQPADFRGKDYKEISQLPNGKLLARIKEKMDKLEVLATRQEASFVKLEKLSKNRINVIDAIPAIMPVANKDLRQMASGFGYRRDPFYHTPSFHPGMDFTSAVGTEIYATANGTIAQLRNEPWGYGNHIVINHGNGYTTLYGHLSRFAVRPGQTIKRGQLIGYVGNTGRSTGSHLHYEVRKFNNPLNPAFFYRNDLSDEQYQRMIELSQREATRFD